MLFDPAFQDELASMYRDGDEGKEAVPPAQLAIAILLQADTGSSGAEAIENAVVEARWRMVLGTRDAQARRERRPCNRSFSRCLQPDRCSRWPVETACRSIG